MKKVVQTLYLVTVGFLVGLFIFMAASFDIRVKEPQRKTGYEVLPRTEVKEVESQYAPLGKQYEYTWTISGVSDAYRDLIFYSYHQNVEVYVGKELVYKMRPDYENAFGDTAGCIWNMIQLDRLDNGKELRVILLPAYECAIGHVPDIYLGEKHSVVKAQIQKDLSDLILCVLTFVAGSVFILFTLYNYKNSEVDKSLGMLGMFAIWMAVWKFADAEVSKLIITKSIAISMLPYLALMLMAIPFVSFFRELHTNKDNRIWYLPCVSSLLVVVVVLGLQFTGAMDMRESLPLVHGNLVFGIIVCAIMTVWEAVKVGWNKKLRKNVLGMMCCTFGFLLDISMYYFDQMTNVGMSIFLIYIIYLGFGFMRDSKKLMDEGMHAKKYERMAFHDQLTGLYNRMAYESFINGEEFKKEHCIVMMLDLNDLKKCNDTLGHEKGDVYIKASADIIQSIFGEYGKCYRMGGDEFCVIIQNGNMDFCKSLVERMQEEIEAFNMQSEDIEMHIACGYEMFDKRLDYDIHDTSGRADKMMYHEKFSMKQQVQEQK